MLSEQRSPFLRYGIAVVAAILALLLTALLWTMVQPSVFPLFLAAVMLSSWYGGLGPGLLATGLAVVTADYFFLPRPNTQIVALDVFLRLGVFVLVALLISSLTAARKRAVEALRESELKFRSVMQSATDAIIAADSRGHILFWNKGAQTIFGYEEAEMVGKPLTFLLPAGYKDAYCGGLERQRTTGESHMIGTTVELYGLKKDGREFPLELSLASWQTGEKTFYSSIIRDLTVRKQAEEALRRAHDELEMRVQARTAELARANEALRVEISERQQAEEQVKARARQQAAVAELGQRALIGGDLSALIDNVVVLVAQTLAVPYCAVWKLLADSDTLLLQAGVGWKDGKVGQITVISGTNSQAGYTLLTNEPVIVEDLCTETRFSVPSLFHEYGVISGISVIIAGHERPFGILSAYATTRRTFSQDDIHFLQAVANVLAEAVRRKRVEEENQQLLYDLSKRVKELTALHRTAQLLEDEQKPTANLLQEIAALFPPAWQYPEVAAARIVFDGAEYATPNFSSTPWKQYIEFATSGGKQGMVEVVYLTEKPKEAEGPFLAEECNLLNSLAEMLKAYFERKEAEMQVAQVTSELVERNAELLRLQREMGRVEPLAALGQVTGTIAHELGTPLNSVLGYTQLLAQEELSESVRESLQIIEAQVQRMVDIIHHYLSRTRRAPQRHSRIDLNELVRDTLVLLKPIFQQHRVQVTTALGASLPPLRGDDASLQRVLINLLNNAVDAMEEGGTVTITTHESTPLETGRSGVLLAISDTGTGVPPELLPRIFDLFETTKAPGKGTGLGLAICQEIVKGHEGTIEISSQVGKGTCVQIFLPTDEKGVTSPTLRNRHEYAYFDHR